MAIENINVGALPNDGSGDAVRIAFGKVNTNFDEVQTLIDASNGNSIPLAEKGAVGGVATHATSPGGTATTVANRYLMPIGVTVNAQESFPAGSLYAMPFASKRGGTIDRIGVRNTTAAPGVTLALGIYETDPVTLLPGALLIDAGTVNLGVAGVNVVTVSLPIAPGALVFLAALPLGGAATLWAMRPGAFSYPSGDTDTGVGRAGLARLGMSALPSPAGITSAPVSSHPIVMARVAL